MFTKVNVTGIDNTPEQAQIEKYQMRLKRGMNFAATPCEIGAVSMQKKFSTHQLVCSLLEKYQNQYDDASQNGAKML